MNSFFLFINERKFFFSFIIVFFIFLLHLLTSRNVSFYYDSGNYWSLAEALYNKGNFSLLNYHDYLRGVWFPIILIIPLSVSSILHVDLIIIIRIFSALYIAFFSAYLIPFLIKRLFPEVSINLWKIVLFSFLIFYFWRDFFSYPLSDFPAIIFLIWSFYFLLFQKRYIIFFSGIALGLAISIRPIYSISFLPIILFLYLKITQKTLRKKLLYLCFNFSILIVGFLFISIPQIVVNVNMNNSYSPMTQTQKSPYGKNLYIQQLIWGVTIEKYETNVGTTYPSATVFFKNKIGEHIAKVENAEKINSIGSYISFCLKRPIELVCIYSVHLFNGIDIKNYQAYVFNISYRNYFFSFLNYSILFLSFFFIFLQRKTIFNNVNIRSFFLLMLFPILLVIPTAIETRFFIPFFILIYIIISYLVDYSIVFEYLKSKKRLKILMFYLIFLLICFVLSNTTYSHIEYLNYKFNSLIYYCDISHS